MSSGKWRPFCLGLNVLNVLKSALFLLQCYPLRRLKSVANFLSVSDICNTMLTCWVPVSFSADAISKIEQNFNVITWLFLQLYENMYSNCPGNNGVSDYVHFIFEITSGGVYLHHVNRLAIPSTTHHGAEGDRLSNCVRQPSHTAPW